MLQALSNGIIDINDVRTKLEEMNRTKILQQHKYAISQGTDGFFRTYVSDFTRKDNRRQIKKKTLKKLEDELLTYYNEKSKKQLMTLEDLYPEWLEYYKLHTDADGTVKRQVSYWEKYYEHDPIVKKRLCDLSKIQLDTWVHSMVKTCSMTKTEYYNMSLILRQSLKYAFEANYISNNPFKDVKVEPKMFRKRKKPESETQVYTLQEEMKIIDIALEDYRNKSNDATPLAIIMLFFLGVRSGEIVAFKDIDVKGNKIEVNRMERRRYEGKNGQELRQIGRIVVDHAKTAAGCREIYLAEDAMKIVDEAIAMNRRNGFERDFYLFTRQTERIKDTVIRYRLEKYCKHAKIPYRSPHKIRKTWISKLIDSGLNINEIRAMAGHESERTTYNCYCFNRNTKSQTQLQLEQTLAIGHKIEFEDKIIPFESKAEKVSKGNQIYRA